MLSPDCWAGRHSDKCIEQGVECDCFCHQPKPAAEEAQPVMVEGFGTKIVDNEIVCDDGPKPHPYYHLRFLSDGTDYQQLDAMMDRYGIIAALIECWKYCSRGGAKEGVSIEEDFWKAWGVLVRGKAWLERNKEKT